MGIGEAIVWWRWGEVVRLVRSLFVFQRNQGARNVPGMEYFVAGDGSVRHKIGKDARRVLKHLPEAEKRFQEMREALTKAQAEVKRKDAALRDLKSTIMAGKGTFPVLMAKLKEAIA